MLDDAEAAYSGVVLGNQRSGGFGIGAPGFFRSYAAAQINSVGNYVTGLLRTNIPGLDYAAARTLVLSLTPLEVLMSGNMGLLAQFDKYELGENVSAAVALSAVCGKAGLSPSKDGKRSRSEISRDNGKAEMHIDRVTRGRAGDGGPIGGQGNVEFS